MDGEYGRWWEGRIVSYSLEGKLSAAPSSGVLVARKRWRAGKVLAGCGTRALH
jgi:hypothetical protein